MTGVFLPSVIIARHLLDMRFAMGATNVLRRNDLARLGGFAAMADYLADDYQLGARMAALGLRVHLSDYVVDSVLGATTFLEQWYREVRWARCSHVSRPREYPGLLISYSTPIALLLLVESGYTFSAWLAMVVTLLIRWWVAWSIMGYAENIAIRRHLIWLPVRDILSAIVWCAGVIGRRVIWRGEEYILLDDGRMQPAVVSPEYQQTSP
jgi:ceramide glucosyltransferase